MGLTEIRSTKGVNLDGYPYWFNFFSITVLSMHKNYNGDEQFGLESLMSATVTKTLEMHANTEPLVLS